MGFAIVLIAAIPAYLAGFVSLFLGMGWLASLGVIALVGTGVTICLLLVVLVRDGAASADSKPGLVTAAE